MLKKRQSRKSLRNSSRSKKKGLLSRLKPSGGYAYTDTRVRAMKSELLPREEYANLMKMSVPEITRYLEEREYKKEIDELSTKHDTNLIEYALTRNMANKFKKIHKFAVKDSRERIREYLRRWDVWNIKTVLRGAYSHAEKDYIMASIVPAGELSEEMFETLAGKENVGDVVAALKKTEYFEALDSAQKAFEESGLLSHFEDALDRWYYERVLQFSRGKMERFITKEIDTMNVLALLKLKAANAPKEMFVFIEGGEKFSVKELGRMVEKEVGEIVSVLKAKGIEAEGGLSKVSVKLEKQERKYGEKLMHEYKLDITPVIGYFAAKEIEVRNLRVLVRGKMSGLTDEEIQENLVVL